MRGLFQSTMGGVFSSCGLWQYRVKCPKCNVNNALYHYEKTLEPNNPGNYRELLKPRIVDRAEITTNHDRRLRLEGERLNEDFPTLLPYWYGNTTFTVTETTNQTVSVTYYFYSCRSCLSSLHRDDTSQFKYNVQGCSPHE